MLTTQAVKGMILKELVKYCEEKGLKYKICDVDENIIELDIAKTEVEVLVQESLHCNFWFCFEDVNMPWVEWIFDPQW